MDALRRQAGKIRDQVAKQQIAVKKHMNGGNENSDGMYEEAEMLRHQQLDRLYRSTKFKRDFQKDLVKATEIFTTLGSKKMEAGAKLSEDCCKYGSENIEDDLLGNAALVYGDARKHIEQEQDNLNKMLMTQVLDPMRSMITNANLDDARYLAQRYTRMRLDADAQAAEISKRNTRVVEAPSQESVAKLHTAVGKMQELKTSMATLGKEAAAALALVEIEQERLTFQRLLVLLEGEKNYHLTVATLLAEVETQLMSEKQQHKATASPEKYFLAEATHAFTSESEKELSLSVGDQVVVRKVNPSGWSEGECNGRGGWFPSSHVEKRQRNSSTNSPA